MGPWQEFSGLNRGYVLEAFERYRQNPASVDPETRALFETWTPPSEESARACGGVAASEDRRRREPRRVDPALRASRGPARSARRHARPATRRCSPKRTASRIRISARCRRASCPARWSIPARRRYDAIEALRRIYCSTSGYDYAHVFVPDGARVAAAGGRSRAVSARRPIRSTRRPCSIGSSQVEAFERFLQRTFPGKTRFSIEGLDMLVPVLDEVIGEAAEAGIRHILIGMAHRGRLNVLAHVLQQAVRADPRGVQGAGRRAPSARTWLDGRREVPRRRARARSAAARSSISSSRCRRTRAISRRSIPVVEGMARAAGTIVDGGGAPRFDPARSAADPDPRRRRVPRPGHRRRDAEPVAARRATTTGGTIHIIANNQLGFTATARKSRTAPRYASGLARGFKIPIVHVNADDPEACVEAARLAFAYRARVPARLPDRPGRLSALRAQRGRRAGVHAAADVPEDRGAADRARDLGAARSSSAAPSTRPLADVSVKAYLNELQEAYEKLQPEQDFIEPTPETPPPGAAARVADGACRSNGCASSTRR